MSTIAETYQRGMLYTFEGHMTKTEKRPNTEPQGVPEALDRFFGKIIRFSIIFDVSTIAETYQRGMFHTFEGHMTKTDR